MTLEMKRCNGCDTDKPLTEFYIRKSGQRAGQFLTPCKQCQIDYSTNWCKTNPEKTNTTHRVWRKNNPEKAKAMSRNATYKNGSKPASENKSCTLYLGCVIAETVLSREFPGFRRMPKGYPGYDYECPKGFGVDVKSSCRNHHTHGNDFWQFHIERNKKAKFFLCIAWKDRKSLIPEHLWLIPGYLVNDKLNFGITDSVASLTKWSKYERSLKNVLECCNQLVSNETLWDRYQETQSFGDLTRYLKHAAYLRIEEEIKHG
jgi:hypothetical protein